MFQLIGLDSMAVRVRDLPHIVIVGYAELIKASRRATHPRRQVMEKRNMFVGMDVHKESIDISVAEEGR